MDSKAIRTIVIFGVVATVALAFLMMFSLDQISDTQTPQIAADIAKEYERALANEPPASVKLTMTRDGKGLDARRVYKMRIRPSAAVAAEDRSLARLMYHCAELCAVELGQVRSEVVIRCVAELPEGTEKEAIFVMDKNGRAGGVDLIRSVKEMPPPSTTASATPETPAASAR